DFKRISTQEIVDYLAGITAKEGLEVSREALALIARAAEGGMRDALSILDQSISFSGQKVNKADVETLLGVVRFELLQEFASAMVSGNITDGLLFIDRLAEEGKDLRQFAKDMIGHFRNLMLVKACLDDPQGADPAILVDVDADQLAGLKEQARRFDLQAILQGISVLSEAEQKIRWAAQEKLPLEMAVVKFAGQPGLPSDPVQAGRQPEARGARSAKMAKTEDSKSGETKVEATEAETAKIEVANPGLAKPGETKAGKTRADEAKTAIQPDSADMAVLWGKLSDTLRQEKHSIQQALLAGGKLIGVEGDSLVVRFGPDCKFHMDQLAVPANKTIVEKAVAKVFGRPLQLVCQPERKGEEDGGRARASQKLPPGETTSGATASATDDAAQDFEAVQHSGPDRQEQSLAPEDDPVVKKALEIFGATIVKIE
ncbi:MAG: hypothetical protein ACM3TT_10880, partial [Syntrophothermus sp.]